MGTHILAEASRFVDSRSRRRIEVAHDDARDFGGVALGVGAGVLLWVAIASIARLIT